jgi:hypothetical protein
LWGSDHEANRGVTRELEIKADMQMDKKEAGPVYGLAANGTETQKRSSQMKITPVNEPRGEGNGWEPCAEDKATSFELDNGKEIVGLFDTRKDAEFAADAEGVWSVLSRLGQ